MLLKRHKCVSASETAIIDIAPEDDLLLDKAADFKLMLPVSLFWLKINQKG